MEEQAHLGQDLAHDAVQPRASGHGHNGAVEMLVGGAQGFVVTGRRGAPAFLDGGPDGGHVLRAASAAQGADFDGAADGIDVVDIPCLQACHEHAAVGMADHQAFAGKFGEGLTHRVAGDAQVLRNGGLREPRAGEQGPLRQLQAKLIRHPFRHGRNGHPEAARGGPLRRIIRRFPGRGRGGADVRF